MGVLLKKWPILGYFWTFLKRVWTFWGGAVLFMHKPSFLRGKYDIFTLFFCLFMEESNSVQKLSISDQFLRILQRFYKC